MRKNTKTDKILDEALKLLRKHGDYGLTMRQVAENCNMTLSNVQYYYKTKDVLLKAMADRYFEQCLNEMRTIETIEDDRHAEKKLLTLLKMFLSHGLKVSEMCKVFREYWAISTRNEAINTYLLTYYQETVNILVSKLNNIAKSDKDAKKAASIIIPFVEGYSITAMALPERHEVIARMLTNLTINILRRHV